MARSITLAPLPGDVSLSLLSYARISADTEKDGHGVREQHADHRQYAAGRGWVIAREFTDNYKSASKGLVRDEFEEMIVALQTGKLKDGTPIHGAIIERFDRASRTFGDWERFNDALTSQPGRVLIIDGQPKDAYADGFLWESAAAMVGAKTEVKKIAARTKASHRRRAMEGRPVGGTRPFGWLPDRVTPDPVEAPLLQRAVAGYIAGKSIGGLVRELWDAGAVTTLGNEWTSAALRKTLANPRNCGLRFVDGEPVRDRDGQVVYGAWEPLISEAQWAAVTERMQGASGVPERRDSQHLLTGFLRCGKPGPDGTPCMASLRVVHLPDVRGHTYQCPTRFNGGCAGVARNGPRLDAYVEEALLARIEKREWQAQADTAWDGQADLDAVLERRRGWMARFHAGAPGFDESFFYAQLEVMGADIRRLEVAQRRFEASRARAQVMSGDTRRQWEENAARGDVAWMRALLGRHLRSVIVRPVGKGNRKFIPESVTPVWIA